MADMCTDAQARLKLHGMLFAATQASYGASSLNAPVPNQGITAENASRCACKAWRRTCVEEMSFQGMMTAPSRDVIKAAFRNVSWLGAMLMMALAGATMLAAMLVDKLASTSPAPPAHSCKRGQELLAKCVGERRQPLQQGGAASAA